MAGFNTSGGSNKQLSFGTTTPKPATPAPVARPVAPAPVAQPVQPRPAPVYSPPPPPPMPTIQPVQPVQTVAPQVQAMPTLQTTSVQDPNTAAFLAQLKERTADQQAGENAPLTASAERATSLAARDIADAAAAQKKKKQEELAARGMRGGGELRAIDEAARTRKARAGADIALGRERDQDQLNLARTGMTNALYGQLGQASQVPFSQQLAGNQQALETWKANEAANMGRANLSLSAQQANAQIAAQQQQQQLAMWNALMGMR